LNPYSLLSGEDLDWTHTLCCLGRTWIEPILFAVWGGLGLNPYSLLSGEDLDRTHTLCSLERTWIEPVLFAVWGGLGSNPHSLLSGEDLDWTHTLCCLGWTWIEPKLYAWPGDLFNQFPTASYACKYFRHRSCRWRSIFPTRFACLMLIIFPAQLFQVQ